MKFYPLFRSLLFKLEAEQAHQLTLQAMRFAGALPPISAILRTIFRAPNHPIERFGLTFDNPIGLAAGYDKDGLSWQGIACLGFGHIEIGTITPKPQPGNPPPRLFRLTEEQALINRMGFPGRGAEFVLKNISKRRPKHLVLGVNVGKNKDTPLETADQDYLTLLKLFASHVDYLSINVSSPNTEGLRQLQERQALDQLLRQLNQERDRIVESSGRSLPLLVKLAPDLSDEQLEQALQAILANAMDGIIATNTTVSRYGIHSTRAMEQGGLSGRPLFNRSLEMVAKIHHLTGGHLGIIGVGGISNADSVQKMLDAGAALVQIYTGLVYQGPAIVKKILNELYG